MIYTEVTISEHNKYVSKDQFNFKSIPEHKYNCKLTTQLSIFPDGSIIVANKHCKNLKELLAGADPYDVREDLLPNPVGGYKICGKKCDSCNNMVDSTSEFVNSQERSFQFDDP